MTTDKYDLGYLESIYDNIRKTPRKAILEIGTKYGYSAFLWRELFPEATIFCLDITPCQNIRNEERIVHIVGNAYDPKFFARLPANYFDLIIDDGPHTYESMKFFLTYYPRLCRSKGTIVLEDIIDTSWTSSLLSLCNPNDYSSLVVHSMAGRQKTPELREKWKNGLDVIQGEKL